MKNKQNDDLTNLLKFHVLLFLHNHIIIFNFIARYSSSLGINSVIDKTVATQ